MRPARTMVLLVAMILAVPYAGAGEAGAVDERAIIEEMDRLIDETPPVRPKDHEAAQALLKKGMAAHDRGDYDRAIELYNQALKKDPLLATAHYEIAYSYALNARQESALVSVVRAIALDPKMEMAYVLKANILDDLGRPEAALAEYDRLLEIMPKSLMGHLNKGISLLRRDDLDGAEAAFRKAEEIAPDAPSVHLRLAQLARERGHDYDEQAHLERFVEVGAKDRRLPQVKERLAQLQGSQIDIDANDPFMAISLAEAMTRSLWRSKHHREKFPEARGYFPTFEEEREVADLVLSLWRQEKSENPDAAHPDYNLLLRVSDAGFLDEYLQYRHQKRFGERGEVWRNSHQERMDRFLAWASSEGLLPKDPTPRPAGGKDEREEFLARDFLQAAFRAAEDSSRSYVLRDDVTGDDARSYREKEGALFREGLRLSGSDQVDCGEILEAVRHALEGLGAGERFIELFRCFSPGSVEWEEGRRLLSRIGWRMDNLDVDLPLSIQSEGAETVVNGRSAWAFYGMCKAAWKHEVALRTSWRGPESYRPSVREELLALAGALQFYANHRDDGEKDGDTEEPEEDSIAHDPFLERMLEVNATDLLSGFILFEMIHKRYGVSLGSLSEADAGSVKGYLARWVLRENTGD